MQNGDLVYDNGEIELKVSVDEDTVWLNKKEISQLFDINRSVVSRHIKNIFADKELDKNKVCAFFAQTTSHGAIIGKSQTRNVEYYNLDIILSVGYRVNSSKAISFRKWATQVLKSYITDGYVINSNKITNDRFVSLENEVIELKKTVKTLVGQNTLPSQGIFFQGEIFDAYAFINDIFKSVQTSLTLIDNYIDESVLILFSKYLKIQFKIITKSISKQLKLDINKYNSQYKNLSIIISKEYHDRFIIIDEKELYHLGASLKDLGKKVFGFSKMDIKYLQK